MTNALPIILCYDSETSDMVRWNDPSEHPRQPHLVELAGILATREGVIDRFHRKVAVDGWTIAPEAAKAHGITTEMALADHDRTLEAEAVVSFIEFWKRARVRVAHNESFDARVVRIACKRFLPAMADEWKAGRAKCTANLSEGICKLPPTQRMIDAGRGHQFKRPKLEEAYRALVGEEIPRVDGVHGALVDAEACLKIYREIWSRQRC